MGEKFIAYFTMEVGISHNIPTYSGGLGVLAGDLLKSFADIKLPLVGITLLNRKGYFFQKFNKDGWQEEHPWEWNVNDFMTPMQNEIVVKIDGRDVKVRAWKHVVHGITGHDVNVFFLDTNIEGNSEYDKTITNFLYGGDREYRLCQEIILGIGGVRMLESLGYDIKKYHMNEGHAALLTIELLRKTMLNEQSEVYDIDYVRKKCVFTTHTPVSAGHDQFDVLLFKKLVGHYVPDQIIEKSTHNGFVNMTLIALNNSKYVNGVAKKHGEVTKEMFPEYSIDSITNGIHPNSWVCPSMREIFDKFIPGWAKDPYSFRYVASIPKEKLWNAHQIAKEKLIEEINNKTNKGFHPARFTIGYGRRFTEYKRPDLILFNIQRLKEVAKNVGDIQIVFSGKAHPHDDRGKEIIRHVRNVAKDLDNENSMVRIVFLENYDMSVAKLMVSGCDIWLNNPQRPLEASGTSGMKAALNGVPQISSLDGWWLEGHIENTTGWSLGPHPQDKGFNEDRDMGDEAKDLYEKLEKIIIPMFYGNKDKWIEIIRYCIAINASFFNTYRVAQQYLLNAYSD